MAVPHTSGTSLAWANPLQHQSLDPSSQLQLLTTPPQTSQHGLVLSPSSPSIPQKLVGGRFVDMKEFLTDNMALLYPGLQASTLLGQRAGQGMFCTLCRGVDHTQARCALYCLQPPAREICISSNRGACIFPKGQCSYNHVCPSCNVTIHRARDCDIVSEESKYKRRLGPTRIPATTTTSHDNHRLETFPLSGSPCRTLMIATACIIK